MPAAAGPASSVVFLSLYPYNRCVCRDNFFAGSSEVLGNASEAVAFESCDCLRPENAWDTRENREFTLTGFRAENGRRGSSGKESQITLACYFLGPYFEQQRIPTLTRAIQVGPGFHKSCNRLWHDCWSLRAAHPHAHVALRTDRAVLCGIVHFQNVVLPRGATRWKPSERGTTHALIISLAQSFSNPWSAGGALVLNFGLWFNQPDLPEEALATFMVPTFQEASPLHSLSASQAY